MSEPAKRKSDSSEKFYATVIVILILTNLAQRYTSYITKRQLDDERGVVEVVDRELPEDCEIRSSEYRSKDGTVERICVAPQDDSTWRIYVFRKVDSGWQAKPHLFIKASNLEEI